MGKILAIFSILCLVQIAGGGHWSMDTVSHVLAEGAVQNEAEASTSAQPRKFGAVEKIPAQIKADFYYVHEIPKMYLIAKCDAVNSIDGFSRVSWYFDDGSPMQRLRGNGWKTASAK